MNMRRVYGLACSLVEMRTSVQIYPFFLFETTGLKQTAYPSSVFGNHAENILQKGSVIAHSLGVGL